MRQTEKIVCERQTGVVNVRPWKNIHVRDRGEVCEVVVMEEGGEGDCPLFLWRGERLRRADCQLCEGVKDGQLFLSTSANEHPEWSGWRLQLANDPL